MGLLPERAIWHARNNPEVLELTEADRQLVLPASARYLRPCRAPRYGAPAQRLLL